MREKTSDPHKTPSPESKSPDRVRHKLQPRNVELMNSSTKGEEEIPERKQCFLIRNATVMGGNYRARM